MADQNLSRIIDAVSDAVIVTDGLARILVFNSAAEALFGTTRDAQRGCAVQALLPHFADVAIDAPPALCKVEAADGRLLDVEITRRVLYPDARPLHTITLRNLTETLHTKALLARLNRIYAARVRIHRAIVDGKGRHALLRAVCRALVEDGGFSLAWIGWHVPETLAIVPVADFGDTTNYLVDIRVSTDAGHPEGRGPCGFAFRDNKVVVSNDLLSEMASLPWLESARESGFRAVTVFPICAAGCPIGTLAVYASQRDFFQADEVALLAAAAADISMAIDRFQQEDARATAEAQRDRERKFSKAMIESMPGIVYLFNEDGRFLRWNRNFSDVTGYADAEIATLLAEDLIEETERPVQRSVVARVFDGGVASLEGNLVTRDGRTIPYLFTGQRLTFAGEPCLVGVGVDLSEVRAARAALEASERRNRATLDAILEGCQLVGFDERYLYLNHAAEVQNRRPASELLGQRFTECWPGIEDHELCTMLRHCLDRREPVQRELDFTLPDGNTRRFDVRMLPDPEGVFLLSLDVTEQRAARQSLLQINAELEVRVADRTHDLQAALARAETSDRTKSTFLATMSHELRTPLNSIIGFSGIMSQGLAGPLTPEQAKQLGMVRGSARHLLELVNDVLDISKIEAGELEIYPRPFDLRDAVGRVIKLLGPAAELKNLPLTVAWRLDDSMMESDQRRIEQVLINIINNAIKFTDHGSVHVEIGSEAADIITVCVIDTGIGIDAQDIDTLFKPFRQIDSGLARSHEGTGLGLAITRRLLDHLGGSVAVESRIGDGTSFFIRLQRRPRRGERMNQGAVTAPGGIE
nr:ATP-binding protein [Polymorphobacter multimanifer]